MTAAGPEVAEPAPPASPPHARGRLLGVFRDPAKTFLVLAIAAGAYLVFVVPYFGGVDEPAHFYRSYQISTGRFVPQKEPGTDFSGACVPLDVILEVQRSGAPFFLHNLTLQGLHPKGPVKISAANIPRCPGDPSKGFVTFSTFGSPVPYAPQAAAAFVTRELGMDANGMLLVERLAVLAAYVAVVWLAIKRSPRSKWALCAVGLLPVAVFQSASSVSHDALTTAVSLLVLSSALRALDPPEGTSNRALLVEALVLSAALGLCKPIYVVIAFCYLLPLLGPRRRTDRWPLAFAPVLGIVVSVGWNKAVGNLWKTDAGYFGIKVDSTYQQHRLTHQPWDFAADTVRTVFDQTLGWLKSLVDVGPSVTHWSWALATVIVAIYAAVSIQRHRTEPDAALHWQQRVLIVLVLLVGLVGVIAANYVYWTTPGLDEVGGVQPRYLVPLLALIPVAIGPLHARWARAATARMPAAVLLVPVLLIFLVSVTYRMH
jgi:uncharacterized membrane protein